MTRTIFENKVTMGNALSAVGMLAAVVIGYADLRSSQSHQAAALSKALAQIEASEARIRSIEQTSAVTTARYESLAQTMGEVKAELRQTNDLLRRVLDDPSR